MLQENVELTAYNHAPHHKKWIEMADEEKNPILDTVPPETDYITYLTILEYQLTPERLPSLLKVLQDDTLTENIGWDLVHLLLPMLPESRSCLDLIARKGNPREVIIRVTELLASVGEDNEQGAGVADDDLQTFEGEAERIHLGDMTLEGMPESKNPNESKRKEDPTNPEEGVEIIKFTILLSMLSILHPRIKSKHPSRFLATSLPAALTAYRRIITPATTSTFLEFLGNLSGRRKPSLPPRASSDGPAMPTSQAPLPDPEAEDLSQAVPGEERTLIRRLLQAVALEICEDFVSSLDGDPVGLSWSAILRESIFPDRIIPGKPTASQMYRENDELHQREVTMSKIMETCLLLGLHPTAILQDLVKSNDSVNAQETVEEPDSPKEYPTAPEDVPFSIPGSMVFLAAYQSATTCQTGFQTTPLPMDISTLIKINDIFKTNNSFIGNSDVIVDSLLAINLVTLAEETRFKEMTTAAEFLTFVRPFVMFSADSPNPQWRYTSHLLATKALEQISNDATKLEVIKEFLDIQGDGPRPLLKGIAIGWLKTQVLAAQSAMAATSSISSKNVFLQPKLLDDLSILLFWNLSSTINAEEASLMMTLGPTLSNIATSLNFYYLLAASPFLRDTFRLNEPSRATDEITRFMNKVEIVLTKVKNLGDDEALESFGADVMAIEMCLDRIRSL